MGSINGFPALKAYPVLENAAYRTSAAAFDRVKDSLTPPKCASAWFFAISRCFLSRPHGFQEIPRIGLIIEAGTEKQSGLRQRLDHGRDIPRIIEAL
jgi:hypothetical protein